MQHYTQEEIIEIENNANKLYKQKLFCINNEKLENKIIFSILLPTFNREILIQRAINSVLKQTFPYFELIVIDDASEDNTEKVIKSYNDKRIVYLKHTENKGQNAAYNTGLKYAKGKYISFIDSDDEWLQSMLEEVYQKFNLDEDLGLVYSLPGVIRENETNISLMRQDYLEGYIQKEVLMQSYLTSPTFLTVKKSCFDIIGPLKEDLITSKDDDMNFLFVKYFKVGLIKKILGVYYFNSNNRLGSDAKKVANGWYILYKNHYKDFVKVIGKKNFANHFITKVLPRFELINDKKMIKRTLWEIFKLNPTYGNFINWIFGKKGR